MYIIKEHSIIPVKLRSVLDAGFVEDNRIALIEKTAADYFKTTVHELDVFYKDTDAKILCCFLLHQVLRYSIGSVAVKYKIDRLYLRKKITEMHVKCLTDAAYMNVINTLKLKLINNPEIITKNR